MDLDTLDIARWQFAVTTVYHFLFVPITIGLSAIVAGYQTAWVRTGHEQWLRLTRFFGRLFLINLAIGVVTGIVQEFQFGMNWSDYSRFVGDVFGAPLAIEGLLAFFLESTFVGLWIFGWDRLPPRLHLATIWLVHVGTVLSAYFILAANSWMQHPVGYRYDAVTGRAELTDIVAVLTNRVQLVTFPHTLLAAYMTAGAFVVGVALWQLSAGRSRPGADRSEDRGMFRSAARVGAVVLVVAGAGVALSGDLQGKVMTEVQPMKMAAAEALYDTEQPAAFSLVTVGSLDGSEELWSLKVPRLLSYLATGDLAGEVRGIDDLRAEYEQTYGTDPGAAYYSPGDYTPVVPVTYWSFRLMIGLGVAGVAGGLAVLWATRRGRAPSSRRWVWLGVALPLMPLLANSSGWVFTEMGRQPWAVFGLMTTERAVSPSVGPAEALVSLLALTGVYAVLAVVEVRLLLHYVARGADAHVEPRLRDDEHDPERPLAVAY